MAVLITQEIKEFINRVKLAFVATVCDDGTPNLSPKGTIMAWDEEHLAFADIHSPGTIDNLQSNASIEINVVDVFLRKGYRFKGSAIVLSEGELFNKVLAYYKSKNPHFVINNIVLVKVATIQPVWSPAYDLGLSEKEVTKRWTEYWGNIYTS